MTNGIIPINPVTQSKLLELAALTGRTAAELLEVAVEEFSQRLSKAEPVAVIPGVDPAELWEAALEAEAGKLTPHTDLFSKLTSATPSR